VALVRKSLLREEAKMNITDKIEDLLVRAYRERPGNPIAVIGTEYLKDPEALDKVTDWRVRKLAVPFDGALHILLCTDAGFPYFRDRMSARRAMR
jgi:hypothetical protein